TGQVDAYYERGLNRWDLAAGLLVATEAGAVAGNLAGGPADTSFVLASAPGLFGSLQDLLVVSHAI
ncbi:MAG: inositol monophosphatase, partial [Actinomycetia bacterium]|nr:inositol monophosphatase [Actinomycetes bacterium]